MAQRVVEVPGFGEVTVLVDGDRIAIYKDNETPLPWWLIDGVVKALREVGAKVVGISEESGLRPHPTNDPRLFELKPAPYEREITNPNHIFIDFSGLDTYLRSIRKWPGIVRVYAIVAHINIDPDEFLHKALTYAVAESL